MELYILSKQNLKILSICKVSDYQIDGIFPKHNYADQIETAYTENVGCFSVGYFEIIVPFNEYSLQEDSNYYLTVEDENFQATSISNTKTTTQVKISDDSIRNQHVIYSPGTYSQDTRLYNLPGSPDPYTAGNGFTNRGRVFRLWASTTAGSTNDDEDAINTLNKLVKFLVYLGVFLFLNFIYFV